MTYILSILYIIFLGTAAKNLVFVEYRNDNRSVTVHNLISRSNAWPVMTVFVLFFVDWLCFLFIFPPGSDFDLETKEIILLLCYAASLVCLSFGLFHSVDDRLHTISIPLGLYYLGSLIAEMTWLLLTLRQNWALVTKEDVGYIAVFILLYAVIKIFWAFLFLFWCSRETSRTYPSYLSSLSCLFKPAFLLFLVKFTSIAELIKD